MSRTTRCPLFPLVASAALLGLAALAACGGAPAETQAEAPPAATPVNVAVSRVGTADLMDRIELSGRLEPWVEVQVASELGGKVESVGFEKGSYVGEGQVLARVGTDLLEAALKEAEAQLTGAEATYSRSTQLFDRQAVTKQSVIDATALYEAAQARVAQARLRLERSIVKAPTSGTAITREVEPGEVLPPGAPITTIHRLDRLKATVGIPESDIALFREGSPATVRVDAWPDRKFEGRVHFIAPSATGSTRTFPAEVAIQNRDGALKPGMIARVSMVRRAFTDAVVIPRDAVQERDTGAVALVLEGEEARVRPLTLGAIEGDRVLVESGLSSDDWLIVRGHRGLIDGQRVNVVERRE